MVTEFDNKTINFLAAESESVRLSTTDQRLLQASTAIHLDPIPDSNDIAYMARQLVQVTLPHRDPGKVDLWERSNGNLTLTIEQGRHRKTHERLGYPFGTIPRLLLFWITTEVLRKQNRRIELGITLAEFMRKLKLNTHGGGKRSDFRRVQQQLERLFHARISFNQTEQYGTVQGQKWLDMQVASQGELWWDIRSPGQVTLFESWIQLGETFYNSVIANPVPVDMRALHALRQSPLALDLYAWSTYRTFRVTQKNKADFIPWRGLQQQLGTDYSDPSNFKKKAKKAFRKIITVYPGLKLEEVSGGIKLYPSKPAIARRP